MNRLDLFALILFAAVALLDAIILAAVTVAKDADRRMGIEE